MKFEIWESKKGEKPVFDFISKEKAKNQSQIAKKLGKFEEYGEQALYQKEHIKPVPPHEGLYEVRLLACKIKYRILGTIKSRIFYLFHMFIKKTDRTPRKEITTALNRKKEFENQIIKDNFK